MRTTFVSSASALLMAAAACSPNGEAKGFGGGPTTGSGGSGGATTTTSSSTAVGTGGLGGGIDLTGGSAGSGGFVECTPGGPDDDVDMDGFTPNQGDCNDCDPNVNPNAVEVPTEMGQKAYDENCDGMIDEPPPPPCDTGIAVDEMDPMNAVKAVELCKVSSGPKDWGVVSAKWVQPDGSPPPNNPNYDLGHGVLPAFGANVTVRKGERMLALSSGSARQPTDPGYHSVNGFDKGYTGNSPMGFPKESPACPFTITGQPHDTSALEVTIRTPSNAHGFTFDFDFFTFEWPGYVCSQYNDFFVAILSPIPMGQTDGNISFDSQGNPVSVNNAFLEVCGCIGNPPSSCMAGGKTFSCGLGDTDLIGTGFGFDLAGDDHGSTSWLRTSAPIDPGGDITIRWGVYDSGDGQLDTTTLVDNWQWVAKAGTTVGTVPVPN